MTENQILLWYLYYQSWGALTDEEGFCLSPKPTSLPNINTFIAITGVLISP